MFRTLLLLAAAAGLFAQSGRFERLADYRGLGALVASAVGPGSAAGSQRFYMSYLYIEHTIDVVAVDPETGNTRVFPNPAPSESGARCMVLGPNGKLYLGTIPQARFYELDPKAGTLKDLGRPSSTETYIWDVNFGSDGKLYGATYPQSKLVRYDPATGKLEDLGRMDPVEQYAHYVAGSKDGFMYVGIGTSRANIVAYEIATGKHRAILPAEFQGVGQARVYRGVDGNPWGSLGTRRFRLQGWTCTPVESAPEPNLQNRLQDGRVVTAQGRTLKVGSTTRTFQYAGNTLALFRMGFGPDDRLYASSVLPIHVLRLDERKGVMEELGDYGGGEFYSFLAHGKWLLGAAYAAPSPLIKYDPAGPFRPVPVTFPGADSAWRPEAMINGPDGLVYIGSVAGYGKLGGPLTVWDPATDAIRNYPHLVKNQSVVSLAVWKNLIVGGTTVAGGGGSHPTEKQAKLFLYDFTSRNKIFEISPIPNAGTITDLLAAPNGLVYGIAGRFLFAFDPETRTVKSTQPISFRPIYNSVALGPDGKIWGLARNGVFKIDLKSHQATMVAESPRPVTAGFGLRNGALYLICGSQVWRWQENP